MLLSFILRRVWRERRVLIVLLFALCLVTAFISLGPLYVRAVASVEFAARLENLTPLQERIDLFNPLQLEQSVVEPALQEQLGDYVVDWQTYKSSGGLDCGFAYDPDRESYLEAPTTNRMHCYQPFAYDHFDSLFELVEGHLPEETSDGIIQAVITRQAQETYLELFPPSNMGVGSIFVVGEDPFTAVKMEVVGIVEPLIAEDDPFWDFQDRLFGMIVPVTVDFDRVEFGLIVPPDVFEAAVIPAIKETRYTWRINMDFSRITVDQLNDIGGRLDAFRGVVLDRYPQATIRIALRDLLDEFDETIKSTQQPIILLSALIMVLMIYNLVTTTTLILEEQSTEWAIITSRGGSISQLLRIQFATVGVLCVIAFLLGPLLAQVILAILAEIGPQADILPPPEWTNIPLNAYILSFVAALVSVCILTLPALPLARHSLRQLRGGVSRPPVTPWWSRYFLDIILLVIGVGLMVRFYSFIDTDLQSLLENPSAVLHMLAEDESIAGLNDPFNLLGPVLLLTGFALLCIRLFPFIMRQLGTLTQGFNSLSARLALWGVERDPGHYAQLVLLLIGTLALGTSSLALSATRDIGAWEVAKNNVGVNTRLTFDPQQAHDLDSIELPDASQMVSSVQINWADIPFADPVWLIGIDPQNAIQAYPQYAEDLQILADADFPALPGQPLDADIQSISIDLYSHPDENSLNPVTVNVVLDLYDANQVRVSVPMTTEDPSITEQFITYEAQLTGELGKAPWRIAGIQLDTEQESVFEFFPHIVYLDNLVATTESGETQILSAFDQDALTNWSWLLESRQYGESVSFTIITDQVTQGDSSLRVFYQARPAATFQPTMNFMAAPQFIPALISPEFSRRFSGSRAANSRLEVGREITSSLDLSTGSTPITRTEFSYTVAGIMDEFAGSSADVPFLITSVDHLLLQANKRTGLNSFFAKNQLFVELDTREPSPALLEQINALPGLVQADYAWDEYQTIQRDPLANSITGILFTGYWVSLALILLDFGFYLVVSLRQRSRSFAVLRAIGWHRGHIIRLLLFEQMAFVTPSLLIGIVLGVFIAFVILPFLSLIGSVTLHIPIESITGLLILLIICFNTLLILITMTSQRANLTGALRQGE